MNKKTYLFTFIIANYFVFSQTNINKQAWIRESYVKSLEISADTNSEYYYLSPILGFSNVFNKYVGIARFRGDELKGKGEVFKVDGKLMVKIRNIWGYIPDEYFLKKKIKYSKSIIGLLSVSNGKLLFQIKNGNELIEEFYYVDHYKDYYFKNIREAYSFLYSIKHNK